MLRRIALASFGLAVAFVVACGHQVTPEPNINNLNLAGKMQIRFRTNGPLNFNNYTYAIVIDTCGNGTPYPNAFATSFNSYSFSFLLGGQYGTAIPFLEQYILTPGTTNSLNPQNVPFDPSLTNLLLNSNGQATEFELTFSRRLLDNPKGVSQPCPNIPPAPRPSGAPANSPSAAPSSMPTTSAQQYWFFNFFTIDRTTGAVLDSLGVNGAQDTSFNGVGVETGSTNQNPIFKQQTNQFVPPDPSAQLNGGEIDNYF